MTQQNDKDTYRITWSEEDNEYAALCAEFPNGLAHQMKTCSRSPIGSRDLFSPMMLILVHWPLMRENRHMVFCI